MEGVVERGGMMEAMSVTRLHCEGLEKRLHNSCPCCRRVSMLWRFDESDVTGARRSAGKVHCVWGTGAGQTAAAGAAGAAPPAAPAPPGLGKAVREKGPQRRPAPRPTHPHPPPRPAPPPRP